MQGFSRVGLWGFLACAAYAQLANQTSLVGTVVDSSGSVVPGAEVTAVNGATQDTCRVLTNSEGYYNIQFVRVGTYGLEVTRPGFQTYRAKGVQVDINQRHGVETQILVEPTARKDLLRRDAQGAGERRGDGPLDLA